MKTQEECYRVLLEGKILQNLEIDCCITLSSQGMLVNLTTGNRDDWNFTHPEQWRVYEKPKWYENIPEEGVLCHIQDRLDSKGTFLLVMSYNKEREHSFRTYQGVGWRYATPCTPEQVQIWLDNAKKAAE